jgi:hypothetical protein
MGACSQLKKLTVKQLEKRLTFSQRAHLVESSLKAEQLKVKVRARKRCRAVRACPIGMHLLSKQENFALLHNFKSIRFMYVCRQIE